MSYVVTIKRSGGKPLSGGPRIEALLANDGSLSRQDEQIVWINPADRTRHYLNIADDHFWTDDTNSEDFLNKLRHVAKALDARLLGEEGEDITDEDTEAPKHPLMVALGAVASVFALPFLLVLFVLRLPWLVWKVARAVK